MLNLRVRADCKYRARILAIPGASAIIISMSNFEPTNEQQAALDAFAAGKNIVLEAGAGTGKTSTLMMLAESTERTGLYIAFNRAVADEIEAKAPVSLVVRNYHRLAYAAVIARNATYRQALADGRKPLFNGDLAKILNITGSLPVGEDERLDRRQIAGEVKKCVENFCRSADDKIKPFHASKVDGATDAQQGRIRTVVAGFAGEYWNLIVKGLHWGKGGHSYYLKLWQLSHPTLDYDYILFDEAQDANPVIDAVIAEQTCQKVFVGDRSQAIYGWNGAIDAMAKFDADVRLPLTQSFRFGHAIAGEANKFLHILGANVDGAEFRIRGFEKVASEVKALDHADCVLCRTNAGVLSVALEAHKNGKRVHIVGKTSVTELASFVRAADKLLNGGRCEHPDLGSFSSWEAAEAFAQSDEADLTFKRMVKLVNEYGTATILDLLNATVSEADADVVVSTAHKAKGREWDSVRLHTDFNSSKSRDGENPDNELSRTDAMLLYVSVTRARKHLDRDAVSWVDGLIHGLTTIKEALTA